MAVQFGLQLADYPSEAPFKSTVPGRWRPIGLENLSA